MNIKIVSLQGSAEFDATALTLETVRGQIQVLENHADMIANVEIGHVWADKQGRRLEDEYLSGQGFLRVQSGDCVLMVDRLRPFSEEARQKAQEDLAALEAIAEEKLTENDREEMVFLHRFLAQ